MDVDLVQKSFCSSWNQSFLLKLLKKQLVRTASADTANILDLVITNNTEIIKEVEISRTTLSDHDLVSVILSDNFQQCSKRSSHSKSNCHKPELSGFNAYNFLKADYDKINNDLQELNWDSIKQNSSDETFPEVFHDTILSICAKYTPLKQTHQKPKRSKYAKVCYAINRKRRKIKNRIKALQHLNPTSNMIKALQRKLLNLEKEAQDKILHCKQMEERKAITAIKANPQYFFSYSKQKTLLKAASVLSADQSLIQMY